MPEDELLERAKLAARHGKYQQAAALFSEAGGTEGAFGEGACLFKMGKYSEARHALSHCLELDPQFEKAEHLIDRIDSEGLLEKQERTAGFGSATAKPMWSVITIIAFISLIFLVVAAFMVYMWMASG